MAILERSVNLFNSAIKITGVRLARAVTPRAFPVELTDDEIEILNYVLDNELTMVSLERLISTLTSCKYAIENNIPGDFVECGVWRGGNALVASEVIRLLGSEKKVYLYDTFQGMTEPEDLDKTYSNQPALPQYQMLVNEDHNSWCYSSLEEVKANFVKRDLLKENLIFVKGDILETLKVAQNIPKTISVLRLDTDWYASTKVELEVLYPRLSAGGFLIIDDFGHWQGSRQAVDEYFEINKPKPFFHCSDTVGRIGVKGFNLL